jgi:hypothetical protein
VCRGCTAADNHNLYAMSLQMRRHGGGHFDQLQRGKSHNGLPMARGRRRILDQRSA